MPKVIQQTAEFRDPLQFAYKRGRGTDDATSILTHLLLEHMDRPGNYARILFVDYSSAFNTMLRSVLIRKLQELGVSNSLCGWIASYLQGRTQRTRVGDTLSSTSTTNIGAPQGCVLSPVLFTMYTNDHRGTPPHTYLVKYADDAAMAGLITDNDETQYRSDIDRFANQCEADGLNLNVGKTKEMIIDTRRGSHEHAPVAINGEEVSIEPKYDYLGTTMANDLTWTAHIEKQTSKASKRLYHLRKLREFRVNRNLMEYFYHSVIETVATFGIITWGGNILKKDRKKLERIRKVSSRIVGKSLTSWEVLYQRKIEGLGKKIVSDNSHPLNPWFRTLPSTRRLQQIRTRRDRFAKSFVPQAIRKLNM